MKQFFKNPSTPLFVLLIGVLIVVAFISHEKFKAFNTSVDLVMHTYLVKTNIIAVKSYLKDAEIGQRGYLLTNDSIFLQPYKDAEQESNLVFTTLDSLVSDNAGQQKNLKHLKKLADERYLLLNNNFKLLKNESRNSFANAVLLKGKNKMDEVRNQVALMLEVEDVLLKERVDSKKDRKSTRLNSSHG